MLLDGVVQGVQLRDALLVGGTVQRWAVVHLNK